jgi:hypothetical protein
VLITHSSIRVRCTCTNIPEPTPHGVRLYSLRAQASALVDTPHAVARERLAAHHSSLYPSHQTSPLPPRPSPHTPGARLDPTPREGPTPGLPCITRAWGGGEMVVGAWEGGVAMMPCLISPCIGVESGGSSLCADHSFINQGEVHTYQHP